MGQKDPFVQAQLIQEALQRFTLRVIFKQGTESREIYPILEAEIRGILGEEIHLSIERVNSIPPGPGGKVHAVISRLTTPARNETDGP